jgi:DNA-binding HxlR family transcriptional regulator
MFKGKKYYGEFLGSDEKISTNILANRLRKLEEKQLITKSLDKTNSSKYLYALTGKGIDLMPMMLEMIVWGAKYDRHTQAPTEFINRFETDKEILIEELLAKLE